MEFFHTRRLLLKAAAALLLVPAEVEAVEKRLAIKGYDPVAHFTLGRPVAGSGQHTVELDGLRWQFANADHQALFRADPDRHAPQYAGYCAYGVAMGKKVEIDPEAWTIVAGRLYLNISLDARKLWRADQQKLIALADQNWQKPGMK